MVYLKKINIKGQGYWYLFHTIRQEKKFIKKSRYLGRELPKDIEKIKLEFLEEITNPKEKTEKEKLILSLTPLERKVFPILKEENNSNKISEKLKLKQVEVVRALGWLESKNLIKIDKQEKELIILDKNGMLYLKKGLPEKQFLKLLPNTLDKLKQDLSQDEINVSIGKLKRENAIIFGKEIKITKNGLSLLQKETKEELFLKKLPIELGKLNNEEKLIYDELKSRKEIIKNEVKKIINASLTSLGKELINYKLKGNLIETLTPEILVKEKWKNKTFRRYDIKANVGKIYAGRRHFVNEAINYVRKIWLELGFKEMQGNLIQTSFWNFDALFVPQDHPARDMQDTFFIKNPDKGKNLEIFNKVKEVHESNYKYKWNPEEARKNILRTHGTVLSARTISQLKLNELPCKYFSVGKVFRNETVDWSHLFEFTQTEGIVIDKDVNFRHLLGYLKQFFNKMGFQEIKFRPSFFSFTEPSVEVIVYHPVKKIWIELGGAGIFRPEVVKPLLGKDTPVLAWGLGLERIIKDYYGINDLRDIYRNDLKKLKEAKTWIK